MCEFMQNKASFMRKGFNRFAFNIDRIIAKYSQKRNETIFIDMNTMTLKSTAKAPYNFNKYAEQTLIRHFGNSVLSAPSNIELDDPEDFREAQKLDQEFEQSFSALNSSRLKCELFVPSQVIGTNQRKSMRLREKLRLPHTPKVNPCFDGCRRTGVNDLSRILDDGTMSIRSGFLNDNVDSFVIPRISQPYVFGAPVHENHENEQLLVNTTFPITALPQLYMLGTPVHEGDENAQLSVNEEIAYSSKKDYLLSWLNDVKKLFAEKSLPVDRMYRRERARKMARNKYQTLGYAMPLPKLRKRMKYDFLYNRSDY